MNNKNKILVGCLALLLVLSVGYAYFSDTITINGTATSKGEFSITTEAVDLNEDIYSNIVPSAEASNGIVESPTISIVNNVVTSGVTLGAPGSTHFFGIKVTNTGSIPAKLSSVIDKTNNETISSESLEEGECYVFAHIPDDSSGLYALLYTEDGYSLDYDKEDYPVQDRVSSQEICKDMFDAVLDPGEEVYFLIQYGWFSTATDQEGPTTLNWQLELNWSQITS